MHQKYALNLIIYLAHSFLALMRNVHLTKTYNSKQITELVSHIILQEGWLDLRNLETLTLPYKLLFL